MFQVQQCVHHEFVFYPVVSLFPFACGSAGDCKCSVLSLMKCIGCLTFSLQCQVL